LILSSANEITYTIRGSRQVMWPYAVFRMWTGHYVGIPTS